MAYQLDDFAGLTLSVALTGDQDAILANHLHKDFCQEDLTFAYWRPSQGRVRFSALISDLILPTPPDRILHGNVSFRPQYLHRVLRTAPSGSGIAFIHGHPKPGWQGMSDDDIVAERDRLASAIASKTQLPLLGLTRGTDGSWSGRVWLREGPNLYSKRIVQSVRVVGKSLSITYPPTLSAPQTTESQVATVSVWGQKAQAQLAQARIGIVGLGSVGCLVAEALSRIGVENLTLVDFDKVEKRNLDRMLWATENAIGCLKVHVAAKGVGQSSTAQKLDVNPIPFSLLTPEGLSSALDCDALVSCVDRPWPRHLLNALAYSHLIPVIDGGIMAAVKTDKTPKHVAWSIQTVGPGRGCLACIGALRRSDVALDRDGLLDDPDYILGLPEAERNIVSRRNVFPFSMSVASHETLQLIGLLTGFNRIGGTGIQKYDAFPGTMRVLTGVECEEDCEYSSLTATGADLSSNFA